MNVGLQLWLAMFNTNLVRICAVLLINEVSVQM